MSFRIIEQGVLRQLGAARATATSASERLSSGLRINRASDDAAGLAVSSTLTLSSRVYTQGVRNVNDGISLLSLVDGALESLSQVVVRLQELAEQASSGVYSLSQRQALDSEAQALSNEYTRIARSTSFNGRELFTGATTGVRIQGGFGLDGGVATRLGGAIGNGSASVSIQTGIAAGATNALAVGDINGDGIDDIAFNDGSLNVQVRLGNGDGTYRFSQTVTYGTTLLISGRLSFLDLNDDGVLDLIGTNRGSGRTQVAYGNGDGTFQAALSIGSITGASVPTDINGDGLLDLVGFSSSTGALSYQLNLGGGVFGTLTTQEFPEADIALSYDPQFGDFNGDGLPDVVISFENFLAEPATMVFLNNGNGTFATGVTINNNLENFIVADLNNDGRDDLITASGTSISRSSGSSISFSTVTQSLPVDTSRTATLDVNGDGNLDLVQILASTATVALGNGDGSFAASTSVSFTAGTTAAVAVTDANGDGVPDLIGVGGTGGVSRIVSAMTSTVDGVQPLFPFSLETQAEASRSLSEFLRVSDRLANQRAVIGSGFSRLETAARALGQVRLEFSSANSRIVDVDIATESARLVAASIRSDLAGAVLAQANQSKELVLRLLAEP